MKCLSGTSKVSQTKKMSPQELKGSSLRTLDFVGSWWESGSLGETAAVHCTWRTWLRCLQNWLNICEKDDSTLCLEWENALSRAVSTSTTMEYIKSFHEERRREVFGSPDSGNVWTENYDEIAKPFVGPNQLVSEKRDTTIESTTLVAYPVHTISLNVSDRKGNGW